ncbi:zinc finger HIT domain-containing protein 3 [Stigmatopora nigra]
MQLCKVCSEQTPKYKCPTCKIRYCSLSCYKLHKDSCLPVEKPPPNSTKGTVCTDTWSSETFLDEDDIADAVPAEKLRLLGHSKEVKDLLCNPHLRELLRTIDSADSKEQAMKAAMQEPLFVEFSDQCLKIVEQQDA